MTQEQITAIENINKNYSHIEAEVDKRRDYRMKNYYDCVDDYSWGGLCDKADDHLLACAAKERDIRILEVKNGGYHHEYTQNFQLRDSNGEVVAKGIRYGQFGPYFSTPTGYVGLPKKLSTLTKKGYTLELVDRIYKCVLAEVNTKGHAINSSMELIREEIKVWEESKIDTALAKELEFADYYYDYKFAA